MRHNQFSLQQLENQSLLDILSLQIEQCSIYHSRSCSELTDLLFIEACLKRVISQNQSGLEFLQALHEIDNQIIPRSTFFDALKSSRRLNSITEMSQLHYKLLLAQMTLASVDHLKDFPELSDYDVFSADGHFIEHPCHV